MKWYIRTRTAFVTPADHRPDQTAQLGGEIFRDVQLNELVDVRVDLEEESLEFD